MSLESFGINLSIFISNKATLTRLIFASLRVEIDSNPNFPITFPFSKISTKAFGVDHKKVLFKMSRKLLRDSYELIPGYKELNKIDSSLDTFVKAVIGNLPLKHKNNLEYDLTIYDIESEIRNIVDGLIISDFFCDIRFDSMWDKELEAVVTRIKFNDKEQVLTSLSGENTETPICYTKTFMTLRERMEETEKIECLWIYLNDKKRKFLKRIWSLLKENHRI